MRIQFFGGVKIHPLCVTITAMHKYHEPVMVKEVIEFGNPAEGETWIDATAGFGGHSIQLSECVGPTGKIIAIEKDPDTFRLLVENVKVHRNIIPVLSDYVEMRAVVERVGVTGVNGILFDLGLSSFHIDRSGRGFSYRKNEPLDMRFDPGKGEPLASLLKKMTERELADVIYRFGEERRARRIASAIYRAIRNGKMETTAHLNEAISSAVPSRFLKDVLPRVYQAFRILVNDELEHVARGLAVAAEVLAMGGRLVIISYHSLEDRLAKQLGKLDAFEKVNRKVVRPSPDEVKRNPRSRSARLRVLKKKDEANEEDIYSHLISFVPRRHSRY